MCTAGIHTELCRQARLWSSCNQSVKSLVRHRKPCAFSGIVHGMYTVYIRSVYTMHILYLYLLCDQHISAWFGMIVYWLCVYLACSFLYLACSFLGTSKGPHREAVWVGLQGAGERAGGACEPLVYVGHRVARFFRTAAGACSHGGGLRESLGWWAGLCAVLAAGAGMAQARNADRSCDTLCSRPARSAARAPRAICAHVLLAWSVFEVVVTSRRLLGRVGDDGLEVGVRHAPAVEGPGALFDHGCHQCSLTVW